MFNCRGADDDRTSKTGTGEESSRPSGFSEDSDPSACGEDSGGYHYQHEPDSPSGGHGGDPGLLPNCSYALEPRIECLVIDAGPQHHVIDTGLQCHVVESSFRRHSLERVERSDSTEYLKQ